ncbi:hypothetical protein MiTe_01382 [Microcystis aeruginosa NIES-2520]|jgi:hypothetical protein|uniref:CHAT domain-containing protein n=2 Tax=Microcystaceae TaxID=1890449 RepID=A0A5A5RN36_MICAE|nr:MULTISPECIES: CHAT domain-containing protein [unclassified Microcystis]GCA74557.1 hypothetical protein MiTe_01382 [Microcystis aeruginosa NIES-2520]
MTVNILVVEDENPWAGILIREIEKCLKKYNLAQYCLSQTDTFGGAIEAINNSARHPLDLLIVDLSLSGQNMGGYLVASAHDYGIPTIVVSGKAEPEQVWELAHTFKILAFFDKKNFVAHVSGFHREIEAVLSHKIKLPVPDNGDDIPPSLMQCYHDFQLSVSRDDIIQASSDQGEAQEQFVLNENEVELTLPLIQQRSINAKLLKALGSKLYQTLFPRRILALFQATVADARNHNCGVRLRLVFESPERAALPWEFLYDVGTNTFLGNDIQTALSRYINVPLPPNEIRVASLPLKILLVIASPTDLVILDTGGEEQLICDALSKQIGGGRIKLDVLHEATIRNITQKLQENPYSVIHFIGHGVFRDDRGFIALVGENGQAKLLDDESFANLFLGNRNLGLCVLNTCEGAEVSSQQIFTGIAPNLVRRGIPAVVAMQYSILDSTAKLFADRFYRALALGWPVDAAIQATRNAISIEAGLDRRDFATPVLYMRAKDGVILSIV